MLLHSLLVVRLRQTLFKTATKTKKRQGIESELPLKLPLKTVFAVTENATRRVFIE